MAQTPTDPTKAQVWITKGIDDIDFEFYIPQGPKGDPGPWVPVSVLGASGTNLNDLSSPGTYSVAIPAQSTDSTLLNYPMHEAGTMMVSTSNAGSVVVQQYMTNTKGMYVRRKFSGNWSPWRFFGHSRTDQSAGRVMYQWDEINQREQLIYGDTGWRNLTGLVANGWTAANMSIRRVNSTVSLKIYNGDGAAKTTDTLYTLSGGFRPSAFLYIPAYTVTSTVGLILIESTGNIRASGGATKYGTGAYTEVSWNTTEAWPTILPGDAQGSVPNT